MDFHDPNQVLLVIIIGWICGIQRMDGRAHGSFKNIYKLYHSLKKTKKIILSQSTMAASLDSNLCIQGNQYPREKKGK